MGYYDEVAADAPFAWYRLNESSGPAMTDSAGTRHGTYTGVTFQQEPARDGTVYSVYADQSAGEVAHDTAFNFATGSDWSIEFWYRPALTVTGVPGLLMKGSSGDFWRVYHDVANDGIVWASKVEALGVAERVILPDAWAHVVLTHRASDRLLTIYVNADMAGSGNLTTYTNASTAPLEFFRGEESMVGWFDEVAFYSTTLSAARVSAHFNAPFVKDGGAAAAGAGGGSKLVAARKDGGAQRDSTYRANVEGWSAITDFWPLTESDGSLIANTKRGTFDETFATVGRLPPVPMPSGVEASHVARSNVGEPAVLTTPGSLPSLVEGWFYFPDPDMTAGAVNSTIFEQAEGATRTFALTAETRSGVFQFVSYNSVSSSGFATSTAVPTGQWVHMVLLRWQQDGTNYQRVYVNGVVVTTTSGSNAGFPVEPVGVRVARGGTRMIYVSHVAYGPVNSQDYPAHTPAVHYGHRLGVRKQARGGSDLFVERLVEGGASGGGSAGATKLVAVNLSGGGIGAGSSGGAIVPTPRDLWHPGEEPDDYYALLGHWTAQRILLEDTTPLLPPVRAACGWHGTNFDPHRGSYAIVRSDGPLAEWVGERVRLTYFADPSVPRSVVVYVLDEGQPLEDVSLSRRAFLALASLASEPIFVTAEVLESTPSVQEGSAA